MDQPLKKPIDRSIAPDAERNCKEQGEGQARRSSEGSR
jgi:hypothetical protein